MPKYLIRQNINGRPLGQIADRDFADDSCATQAGEQLQDRLNEQFNKAGTGRCACPKVEVLRLVWQGEPQMSQAPRSYSPQATRREKEIRYAGRNF